MFKIYKGESVVVEGESPLTITGIDPNTEVPKGEYQAVRVEDDKESDRVDIPAFTTLSVVNSRETLVEAINKAGAGDTVTIDEGFILDERVSIPYSLTIDGGENVITSGIGENEPAMFIAQEGDISFKNIDIKLSSDEDRAFIVNANAGDFGLENSNIIGSENVGDHDQRGISTHGDYEGKLVVDGVEFKQLDTGIYQVGNNVMTVNNSTFDSNHRGMTIEGNEVPTLTNNVFTGNDGDISASYDSEIRSDIAEEAENPNNNNTFDDDKPKYNWSVTSVSLSPKTSTAESGTAGDRDLTATVEPEHALNKTVIFSTEDVEGLSVSSSGKLEWTAGTPAGTYTTTVTTTDGAKTDTHVLTLTEPEPDPDPEPEEPTDPEEGE